MNELEPIESEFALAVVTNQPFIESWFESKKGILSALKSKIEKLHLSPEELQPLLSRISVLLYLLDIRGKPLLEWNKDDIMRYSHCMKYVPLADLDPEDKKKVGQIAEVVVRKAKEFQI